MKDQLKSQAVELRKSGLSYTEILAQVPVAKSTLSEWLRAVGLSKRQYKRLTEKSLDASRRGAAVKKQQRIDKTRGIHEVAIKEVGSISRRELFLMGTMLYWAEGSKEKAHRPHSRVDFSNSDPFMVSLFLKWLDEVCDVDRARIHLSIYIHENSRARMDEVYRFWMRNTGFSREHFKYVYFKKHNPKTIRKKVGSDYFGNIRVQVTRSTDLNRRIAGWVKGVNQYYCRVV